MEKYSKLSFIIIISLLIFIAAFAIGNRTPKKNGPLPEINVSEINNSKKTPANQKTNKYLLRLEGNTLCAYFIKNGNTELIEKSGIEALSISPEDIKNLEQGIYADSREELLSYFESYTS